MLGNTGILQHFFTLFALDLLKKCTKESVSFEYQVGHLTLSSFES